VCLAIALLVFGYALAAQAGGAIYSFIDDKGVTHFTNNPKGDNRYQPLVRRDFARTVPKWVTPRTRVYDTLIARAAANDNIPAALVKAVIAAESGFDSQAVSQRGAQGLMQLMPETAASVGVENAFEPAQNVRGGTSYLRSMIDRYGDLSRALAAYNAGPTAVDKYGGIPPYDETRDYVDRVLTYYRRYHGDFPR
jgi:soluble lytic murein transglycosylase-like protein